MAGRDGAQHSEEEDSQIADRANALLRQRDGGEGSEDRHEERGPASADNPGDHILGVARRRGGSDGRSFGSASC